MDGAPTRRGVLECGSHEEREPQRVVRVVTGPTPYSVSRSKRSGQSMSHARAPRAIGASKIPTSARVSADAHGKCLEQSSRCDAAIARHGDDGVPSEPRQRRRQRAQHVREAAGLRKRDGFRADEERRPHRRPLRADSNARPRAASCSACARFPCREYTSAIT